MWTVRFKKKLDKQHRYSPFNFLFFLYLLLKKDIWIFENSTVLKTTKIMENINTTYDYLDHIPVDGWMWEFIRRNFEYKSTYAELETLFPDTDISTTETYFSSQDLPLGLVSNPKFVSKKLELLEKKFGVKPNTRVGHISDSYLVKEVKGTGYSIGIPNPEKRYCDIDPKPVIRGSKPVATARFKEKAIQELRHGDMENFYKYCYKTINKISPSLDIQNTLYVGC